MRFVAHGLALIAIMLPAVLFASATARTVDLVAFDAGGDYWFQAHDRSGRNPELVFAPGDEIWINVRSAGRESHNLHLGQPVETATDLSPPGHTLALRFVAPDVEGEYAYWCDPHRELGMQGIYRVTRDTEETPAPVPPALLLAAALTAGAWRHRP